MFNNLNDNAEIGQKTSNITTSETDTLLYYLKTTVKSQWSYLWICITETKND